MPFFVVTKIKLEHLSPILHLSTSYHFYSYKQSSIFKDWLVWLCFDCIRYLLRSVWSIIFLVYLYLTAA